MNRNQVLSLLTQRRREISAFGVKRLAVFGSVARNAAGPNSDVDVLVEFEGTATFDQYIELNFYLEDLLQCPVDLLTNTSLRDFLRDAVEQEAIDVQGLTPVSR